MPFKLPADVGISSKLRKPLVRRLGLSREGYGRVRVWPRVLRYSLNLYWELRWRESQRETQLSAAVPDGTFIYFLK